MRGITHICLVQRVLRDKQYVRKGRSRVSSKKIAESNNGKMTCRNHTKAIFMTKAIRDSFELLIYKGQVNRKKSHQLEAVEAQGQKVVKLV